jgi:hypothetical protein
VARRGAAVFRAATFVVDRDFGFAAVVTGFLLRAADFFTAPAFFAAGTLRGAALEVVRVRWRAEIFRLAVFLLGGIAGSLAGGADRLGGAAG